MWCWRRMENISWTDLREMQKCYKESRNKAVSYIQYTVTSCVKHNIEQKIKGRKEVM